MTRKPAVSAEESGLFRDALKDVTPLAAGQRRGPRRRLPTARPRTREQDERDVIDRLLDHAADPAGLDTGDELSYRMSGVQDGVLRRLRRGQYAIQGELDLHGCTLAQARIAVTDFLRESRRRNRQCVRIIHGKGLRSPQRGPVLKPKLALWLRQRDEVLAYCSARLVDGGSGALYVLLRRAP